MLLVYLLRYLRGFVRFSARGGFPERFINLCAREGIPLWDATRRDGVLYACTTVAGYRGIRPCARKSGMCPRVRERHGLRFFMHRYRRRVGMLAGLAAFAVLLVFLSGMVWTVEVTGNERLPDEKILSVFEELGVYTGARAKAIDVDAIKLEAIERLPELSWLAVNLHGSNATIEVRERVMAPPLLESTPANVCAARDGLIVRLEPYQGEQMVRVGSAVKRGDLLISGVKENKDLSISLHHAHGLAVAHTQRAFTVREEYTQTAVHLTGKTRRRCILHFFGLTIPLGPRMTARENELFHTERTDAQISGKRLPIGLTCESYLTYELLPRAVSPEDAKLLATQKLMDEIVPLMEAGTQVVDAVQGFTEDSSGSTWQTTLVCREEIGVEVPIETE